MLVRKNWPRVVAEALYAYRLVRKDTSTDKVVFCDAGEFPEGVVSQDMDADDVTNGIYTTIHSLLLAGATVRLIAAGAISAGADVFTAADGKVSATRSGVRVGTTLNVTDNAATADGDEIEVIPSPEWLELVAAQVAAGTAVTDTTTETIVATATFEANSLKDGDVIDFFHQTIATATNSTDTLTLKAYLNAVELCTTGAVDVADDDIGVITGQLVIRGTGASAKFVGAGAQALDAAGITMKAWAKAEAAIDTTAAATLTVKATWSVASASNSCRSEIHNVRRLR